MTPDQVYQDPRVRRVVRYHVHRWSRPWVAREDVEQEAWSIVYEAARTYQGQGPFHAYAARALQNSLRRYVYRSSSALSLPRRDVSYDAPPPGFAPVPYLEEVDYERAEDASPGHVADSDNVEATVHAITWLARTRAQVERILSTLQHTQALRGVMLEGRSAPVVAREEGVDARELDNARRRALRRVGESQLIQALWRER